MKRILFLTMVSFLNETRAYQIEKQWLSDKTKTTIQWGSFGAISLGGLAYYLADGGKENKNANLLLFGAIGAALVGGTSYYLASREFDLYLEDKKREDLENFYRDYKQSFPVNRQ